MNIEGVKRCGRFVGKPEMLVHLHGAKLAKWRAIKAKCFECMCGYADGGYDCRVRECPLYPFMPYRGQEPRGASAGSTGLAASKTKQTKGTE